MSLRNHFIDYSKGDNLRLFWLLFRWRSQTDSPFWIQTLTFFLNRIAHRHGGYIGNGAIIEGIPALPHGLHGIYISRYSHIKEGCRIYQNVTIGEVHHLAPTIGEHCLIGAGATIIGNIRIGNYVKIGAGAVVCFDVPDGCTVVSPPAVIIKETKDQINMN